MSTAIQNCAHAFGTGVTLKPGLLINPDHLYMANEVHAD